MKNHFHLCLCIPKVSGYWYAPGYLAAHTVGTQIIRWPVTTTIWPPNSKCNDSTGVVNCMHFLYCSKQTHLTSQYVLYSCQLPMSISPWFNFLAFKLMPTNIGKELGPVVSNIGGLLLSPQPPTYSTTLNTPSPPKKNSSPLKTPLNNKPRVHLRYMTLCAI